MDRQWILTLQISLCAAFVLFSANEIIFLNLRLFNLLSIAILFVVLLQLSRLKLCDHGLTAARAYMLLALVFLAGINIKSRPRASATDLIPAAASARPLRTLFPASKWVALQNSYPRTFCGSTPSTRKR